MIINQVIVIIKDVMEMMVIVEMEIQIIMVKIVKLLYQL
jgi:hypothetical protein